MLKVKAKDSYRGIEVGLINKQDNCTQLFVVLTVSLNSCLCFSCQQFSYFIQLFGAKALASDYCNGDFTVECGG